MIQKKRTLLDVAGIDWYVCVGERIFLCDLSEKTSMHSFVQIWHRVQPSITWTTTFPLVIFNKKSTVRFPANALELPLSCAKPYICIYIYIWRGRGFQWPAVTTKFTGDTSNLWLATADFVFIVGHRWILTRNTTSLYLHWYIYTEREEVTVRLMAVGLVIS